ncbi:MAG: hypothetical protein ACI8Q1_002060 [Parvicella sp.]|jgi:hypothetical protein
MKKVLYLVLLLSTLISCSEEESRKEYYYSLSETTEAKIYKYVIDGDDNQVQYWKVTTIPESSFIVTETYDSDLILLEKFEEVITEQGAELIGYTEFRSIDIGGVFTEQIGIKTKVIQKDVYKWNSSFSYSWSVEFPIEYGGNTLTKTRTQSNIETIKVGGKEYKTATFNDEYCFNKNEGKKKEEIKNTMYQKTFYAKDIGVIKTERRFLGEQELLTIELSEVLTNREFELMLIRDK